MPAAVVSPRVWWRAIRPASFTATTTPVVVGLALTVLDGRFAPLWAALTLLGVVLLQAGTNLLNDYYDFRSGADDVAHRAAGALQQQALPPRAVLAGGLCCFALGTLCGVAATVHGGPLVWGLLGLALLVGITYTGGPFPLAYHGLGELAVFLAMGPAITLGTYLVQTGAPSAGAVLAGVPVGLLVTAVLQANNLRDLPSDKALGKLTLAARLGRGFGRAEYAVLLYGAYVALALVAVVQPWLGLAGLPTLLTLPAAVRLGRLADATEDASELNGLLRGTSRLHGRFGYLWAAGLLVAALVRWVV